MTKRKPGRPKKNLLPDLPVGYELITLDEVKKIAVSGLPPLPVFDEQIHSLTAEMQGFTCNSREDFERAKQWYPKTVSLVKEIQEAFRPRKQAFDAAKQPTLRAEDIYLYAVRSVAAEVRNACSDWQEAERRKEMERLEAERRKEMERLEAERQAEIERRKEESGVEVEPPPVIPPRMVAPDVIPFSKGVSLKKRLVARIVDPSKVARQFCEPKPSLIDARVRMFSKFNPNPTSAEIDRLAQEIGGVVLEMQ